MAEGLRARAPNFSLPAVKEKPCLRTTKFPEFSGHLLGRRAQLGGQMHPSALRGLAEVTSFTPFHSADASGWVRKRRSFSDRDWRFPRDSSGERIGMELLNGRFQKESMREGLT